MNPVRQALMKRLSDDPSLSVLAPGGVHYQVADPDAVRPYVIFQKMSGTPTDAFAGPSLDRDVWLVKGVGNAEQAEDINKRCHELLQRVKLSIIGLEHQELLKISDVDYLETEDGETFNHVGAEYKVSSEEETK